MDTDVRPGPRDPSVLRLQSIHRSDDLWTNPDAQPLTVRRADADFRNAYPLDIRVQQILRDVGFYGVYMAGHVELDHALITALVERWRRETHTFHLPVGEATITLQDIAVLWGLPIDGHPVTGRDPPNSVAYWQGLCNDLLGFMPHPDHFQGDRLMTSSIEAHLAVTPLTPDSTENQVLQHARCRILQILASIMSDKSSTKVKLMYLPLLSDIREARNYSWGSATLACLYRALCNASKKGTTSICGPVVLIQMWMWERLPVFRPTVREEHIHTPSPDMPIGPRGCM